MAKHLSKNFPSIALIKLNCKMHLEPGTMSGVGLPEGETLAMSKAYGPVTTADRNRENGGDPTESCLIPCPCWLISTAQEISGSNQLDDLFLTQERKMSEKVNSGVHFQHLRKVAIGTKVPSSLTILWEMWWGYSNTFLFLVAIKGIMENTKYEMTVHINWVLFHAPACFTICETWSAQCQPLSLAPLWLTISAPFLLHTALFIDDFESPCSAQ